MSWRRSHCYWWTNSHWTSCRRHLMTPLPPPPCDVSGIYSAVGSESCFSDAVAALAVAIRRPSLTLVTPRPSLTLVTLRLSLTLTNERPPREAGVAATSRDPGASRPLAEASVGLSRQVSPRGNDDAVSPAAREPPLRLPPVATPAVCAPTLPSPEFVEMLPSIRTCQGIHWDLR